MRSSNNDITAPISRIRRRKTSSTTRNVAIFVTICIVLVVAVLARLAFTSSGDFVVVQPESRDVGTKPSKSNSYLRRTVTVIQEYPKEDEGLLIHTNLGTIKIYFTPELSGPTSIEYITQVVSDAANANEETAMCDRCTFYRAEPDLLLQGVISHKSTTRKVLLGPCPLTDWSPTKSCPQHDPNCGCHGPVMTKGMVGWAGGGSGPDFFINTHKQPVDWWEHQHTVWGQVRDDSSLQLVEKIYKLPATTQGMRMLDEKIQFRVELF